MLSGLVRKGLGAGQGSGRSSSHGFNMTAPAPLPKHEFIRALRQAWSMPFGLRATAWMLEIKTFAMRSESELVLKSRRVVPTLLLKHGF